VCRLGDSLSEGEGSKDALYKNEVQMPTTVLSPSLTKAIDTSPYQRWLGVFVLRSQAGDVELLLPYRDEFHNGTTPVIHQGIIAALADITRRLATTSLAGQALPTHTLRLEYLQDAAIGNQHIILCRWPRTITIGT